MFEPLSVFTISGMPNYDKTLSSMGSATLANVDEAICMIRKRMYLSMMTIIYSLLGSGP